MRADETDISEVVDVLAIRVVFERLGRLSSPIGNIDVDIFPEDEKLYILEMSARFGDGYPFSHIAGCNLLEAIVNWAKRDPVSDERLQAKIDLRGYKELSIAMVQIGDGGSMKDLKGKKLLVIGGAFQHCKLVEAAKELGVTVYVTDYLPVEEAPAKQIADKYFMHNITEIDAIVDMCRKEDIDGVIATSLDACQLPYQEICEKLGVPCFGTAEQYKILTDKIK